MDSPAESRAGKKVLVIFGAVALYGMERGVIEIFDLLRPEVEPQFLISRTPMKLGLPLFNEITRRNFDHTFLSDHEGWERPGKPRSLTQFGRMLSGLVRGNIDALRAVRGSEMIYVPNLLAAYYSLVALLFCRLTRRRIFYHFHDLYSQYSTQLRFISFFVTDFIHNTAYGLRDVSLHNRFILKKRNVVIPYPVSRITTETANEQTDPGALLFVGQVARHKGVDILLDAFEKLATTRQRLSLILLGGCEDKELEQRLQSQRLPNGCEVHWLGYRDDVAEFLKTAYLHVHPSPGSRFSESFGIGMLEAMAAGVPGVCFRSGALTEVVVDHETGLICEEETAGALSTAIEKFLDDVKFRNECGERARQRFQTKYSPASIKRLWLSLLDSELENRVHGQVVTGEQLT